MPSQENTTQEQTTQEKTTIELLVQEDISENERLDKFLAFSLSKDFSRERIKKLIQSGNAMVNRQVVTKPSAKVNEGDWVALAIPDLRPLDLPAEDIPLDIIFEDSHLLVVNKPSGMLTHPLGEIQTSTLVNALLHHCHGQLSGINGVTRPGIVHRLDRDTAGLLMVAKTDAAHRSLAEQIRLRTAKREYIAIVQGNILEDTGVIDAPIGRNPKFRQKMMVSSQGRHAATHWKVLERIHDRFTFVRLALETGRTHQIRVHLSHIRHPILGDPLYGSGIEKNLHLKTHGQLLQAVFLSFCHPASQQRLTFQIEPEPEIIQTLEKLRNNT